MAKRLETILAKKSWTGKEVGIALLRNLEHDLEHMGETNVTPLFPEAEFNKMRGTLDNPRKLYEYGIYSGIYNYVIEMRQYAAMMLQQFYNGFNKYMLEMREVQRAEDTYSNLEQFPLVLTRERYNKLLSGEREKKRANKESFYSLVFTVLKEALTENPPEDLQGIAALADTYSGQRATNPRILENWYEDTGAGYYLLEDGRRSDRMNPEEWQAALAARFMDKHKLTINGEPATLEETTEYCQQERILAGLKLFFSGADGVIAAAKEKGIDLTPEEAEDLLKDLEAEINHTGAIKLKSRENLTSILEQEESPLEWHYPDEAPSPSKLEVLQEALERYSGYWEDRLVNGEFVPEVPEREQYKEFKRDYPELAAALEAYIKERIPAAATLKPAQYFKPFITWGELADLSFTGFPEWTEAGEQDIAEYYAAQNTTDGLVKSARVAGHGIAILQGNPRKWDDDGSGELKDPIGTTQQMLASLNSLEALERDTEHAESIAFNLEKLALPALRYVYAYNAVLQILTELYDCKFLYKKACIDTSYPESQIDGLNGLMYYLYKDVYGTAEGKKRKRELIKEIFQPIEIEGEKPTAEALEQVRDTLEGADNKEVYEMLKHPNRLVAMAAQRGSVDE